MAWEQQTNRDDPVQSTPVHCTVSDSSNIESAIQCIDINSDSSNEDAGEVPTMQPTEPLHPPPGRVERLAAQRKIERLASYRFCRAIAIHLKQRTNGCVTSNSFTHTDYSQLTKLLKPSNPNLLGVVQRARDETTLGGDILISRSVFCYTPEV